MSCTRFHHKAAIGVAGNDGGKYETTNFNGTYQDVMGATLRAYV